MAHVSPTTSNIPFLGMGTWGMGGKFERDESNIEDSIEALRYGLSLGISMIDVAELYGEGLTEEIVGDAIDGMKREDIYLASKVDRDHLHHADVLKAVEGSLRRMKTGYLDLYFVHKPNPEIPLKETMEAMEQLFDEGKIRAIGVGNFDAAQLAEAQSYLKHSKIVANQIEYNLASRDAEREVIPYCQKNGIHVIAHRPFGKGTLARQSSSTQLALAEKYHKTPNQVALNWIISQGHSAIPKSSDHEHLKENAGALGWTMDTEDIERLKSAT